MRILQIVADGTPGGGTNHVLQLLRGLPEAVECSLVTQEKSYLHGQAADMNVRVFGGDFFRSRVDQRAVATIRSAIREYQPDLVHCHGGRAAFFRSMISSAMPTIYTVHGFHYANKEKLLAKIAGWAGEYWTIRKMARVLFVCDHDRVLANRSFLMPHHKNFQVVFNGIQPPTPRPKTTNRGVGFIGRFVYQKNPQLFLDMVQQLPTGAPVVMVGGGAMNEEVRAEIRQRGLQDRIQLLGELDHPSTLDVLSQLDVLVMTPRWEGLPLLPLEAMFLNVPVVSTSVGGIPEVITHGQTGLLSKNEDGAELAGLVQQMLTDDALRNSIVGAANQMAHEKFSQETMLKQIENCYQELLRQAVAT